MVYAENEDPEEIFCDGDDVKEFDLENENQDSNDIAPDIEIEDESQDVDSFNDGNDVGVLEENKQDSQDGIEVNISDETDFSTVEENNEELQITGQPSDYTGKVGEKAIYFVKAEGKDLKYQWQYSKDGGKKWTSFQVSSRPSAAKANFEWVIEERFDGWICRCRVTDSEGNMKTSDSAKMSVKKEEESQELKITDQPSDYTGKVGEKAIYSVKAEGKDLKYQWQYSKDGGKNWISFQPSARPSAAKADFEWVIEERFNGWICRCRVTDGKGNVETSDAAKMLVKKEEESQDLKITGQPSDYTGKVGEKAIYSVKAEGKDLKYQWQYSKDGGKNWTSFQSSARPSVVKADFEWVIEERFNGWICRCRVTDGEGNAKASDTAKMLVKKEEESQELKITGQPSDYTGKVGETAVYSVKVEGKDLEYQWQYSEDGGNSWTDFKVSGRPSAARADFEWVIKDRFNNWLCRCMVTDKSGNSLASDAAVLHVYQDNTVTESVDYLYYSIETVGTWNRLDIKKDIVTNPRSSTDPLIFRSLNTDICSVSEKGFVTFNDIGTTNIVVISGNAMTRIPVTVEYGFLEHPKNIKAYENEWTELTAKANMCDPSYSWWYQEKNTSDVNTWKLCRDEDLYKDEGTNTLKVLVNTKTVGRRYRCLAEYSDYSSLTGYVNAVSHNATITINKNPKQKELSSDITAKEEETVKLWASFYGSVKMYRWMYQTAEEYENGESRWHWLDDDTKTLLNNLAYKADNNKYVEQDIIATKTMNGTRFKCFVMGEELDNGSELVETEAFTLWVVD